MVPYRCPVCEDTLKSRSLAVKYEHFRKKNHTIYVCPDCPQFRMFFLGNSMKAHYRAKHLKTARPQSCSEMLYTAIIYAKILLLPSSGGHIQSCLAAQMSHSLCKYLPNSDKCHQCKISLENCRMKDDSHMYCFCGESYHGKNDYEHWKESTKHLHCFTCKEGVKDREALIQHSLKNHPDLCCVRCNRIFKSTSARNRHHFTTHWRHGRDCPCDSCVRSESYEMPLNTKLAFRKTKTWNIDKVDPQKCLRSPAYRSRSIREISKSTISHRNMPHWSECNCCRFENLSDAEELPYSLGPKVKLIPYSQPVPLVPALSSLSSLDVRSRIRTGSEDHACIVVSAEKVAARNTISLPSQQLVEPQNDADESGSIGSVEAPRSEFLTDGAMSVGVPKETDNAILRTPIPCLSSPMTAGIDMLVTDIKSPHSTNPIMKPPTTDQHTSVVPQTNVDNAASLLSSPKHFDQMLEALRQMEHHTVTTRDAESSISNPNLDEDDCATSDSNIDPPTPEQVSTSRFNVPADAEPTSFQCQICLNRPTESTATMCGHVFCRSCIISELSRSLVCPACKQPILVRLSIA